VGPTTHSTVYRRPTIDCSVEYRGLSAVAFSNGQVRIVRFRMRPVLMVVCAVVIVVALSVIVMGATRPAYPRTIGLLTTQTTSVAPVLPSTSTNYESIGGCAEDAHDHNHDVDPKGFVDQEDDECLPAQHAARLPDGQLKH
jgi:hypothetical protein